MGGARIAAASASIAWGLVAGQAHAAPGEQLAANGRPYLEVAANPARGFNYPYLLFTPPQMVANCSPYLVVEPNNAGGVSADDATLNEARQAAIKVATGNSLGNLMAQHLAIRLLVPVFPRPPIGADSDLDTYSLTRATLLAGGKLKRIDLQLAAMIADAEGRVRQGGHDIEKPVFMTGFSGSGLFVSRFVFLHPDMVAAAAFGGINSFIMLPVVEWQGKQLEYPLGLADYAAITGHKFDAPAYAAVPQLAFMGANDSNDAVPNDDEYSTGKRDLVWMLFGKYMAGRWRVVQTVYGTVSTSVRFATYSDIGHSFDERAVQAVTGLFKAAARKLHVRSGTCQ